MKTITIILMLSLGVGIPIKAQTPFQEYFIKVEPSTGIHTIINVIPGVSLVAIGLSSTAIDKVNNRFFFCGNDTAGEFRLYTLDANTGNVLHSPLYPHLSNSNDNAGQLQFDDSLQTLFGLSWNSSEQKEYFISVDEVTGHINFIKPLPDVNAVSINSYTYDQSHHVYLFEGYNNAGMPHLYSISAITGDILSQPPIVIQDMNSIRYDNSTGTLYGNKIGSLLEVNAITGTSITLGDNPSIFSYQSMPNYMTFDEIHHRYIMQGFDNNNTGRLYSLEATTAVPLFEPLFPVGLDSGENVIELNFNNTNGILYGLHWGTGKGFVPPPVTPDTASFIMANAFTPNGDGKNDRFYPILKDSNDLSVTVFKIYDRWGQLIYDNPTTGWDGNYKTALQPAGVYSYFLSVNLPDPTHPDVIKEIKEQGQVTLIR